MKIGELATAAGLRPATIRFYETEGLLPKPQRTSSSYRIYEDEDIGRLQFIKKAQRLGLSLEEIRGVVQLHNRSEPTCVHVRALLEQKLRDVDALLRDLREFRAELARLRDSAGTMEDCRPTGGVICGIVERSEVRAGNGGLAWLEGDHRRKLGKARQPALISPLALTARRERLTVG